MPYIVLLWEVDATASAETCDEKPKMKHVLKAWARKHCWPLSVLTSLPFRHFHVPPKVTEKNAVQNPLLSVWSWFFRSHCWLLLLFLLVLLVRRFTIL